MGPPTWFHHFTLASFFILALTLFPEIKGEISPLKRKTPITDEYRVSQESIKNKDDLTMAEFLSDEPPRQTRIRHRNHRRRYSTPRTRRLQDVDYDREHHRQEETSVRREETHYRETHRQSGGQPVETVTSHYSRTVWANRSDAHGSYFDRNRRTTTQRSRYPTPYPVGTSVDPCDELLHREDIYGKYSPGDILDLGLDPHGCLEFNMTLPEDPIHPLTIWYNPTGPYRIPESCDYSQCYPVTGDLLIGRENLLSATSTCGLYTKERFCIVSHLEDKKKCFHCDSREHNVVRGQSHRIDNIVYRLDSRKKTWWQSESGKEQVSVRLDLEAEFHFTHLIIKFKTFRPAAMFIERSQDHGLTWQVYRYFAYDCAESFPGIPRGPPRSISDVICESRYSEVAPSTRGELIYRVLPPNFRNYDPWSGEVQNLLKMTNLRINFTRLHTLGDNLLDQRAEIKEKYYYAIYNMVVRGSCSCYGHASQCDPINPDKKYPKEMVHGRCNCTHFTTGLNCEKCMDFYNDLPWKPANGTQTNACKRCNCHEHSDRCHFDHAIFAATGNVSGGVCDECQHNTMGRQCEMCKHFFYRDSSRDITDPYACLPCDCDPRGSLDNGICDSTNDLEYHFEAGRCYCKANVQGRRCDRCQDGFWNFQEVNPNGCDSCTCDPLGTVSGIGCNQNTGECTCKRYVSGRDCNQCMSEHWGLSEDRDGCHPCDCDPGGSFDNNCDVVTGQCRCRSHVIGRRCDRPDTGYFAGLLDYYVYEGELARGCDNCEVIVREPWSDRDPSWTGVGFMRGYEGSKIEFDVSNVQRTMDYDIVIRYEPQLPRTWEEAHIIIERPGPVDRNDKCSRTVAQDDHKRSQLPSGSRDVIVFPPVCLERGRNYKIILELRRYDAHLDTPTATVLIDSIVLIPRIESIPFFHDSIVNEHRRQEFERFRCGQTFSSVTKQPIPEVCKKHLISIGFYVYEQAIECNCDPTGSTSAVCDSLGGQCSCKAHVVGRRCDRCAPGTYGFSPSGCRACDCDSVGSQDNFCEAHSGQCKCRQNTYGRQCDECQPGFWSYPNCARCDCNGHADTCDSRTGNCLECRDFTVGNQCESCLTGFYGDPRIGINVPCRACQCPGLRDGGHSYADTCHLDSRLHTAVCNCREGYSGERCDRCADNFFGNPDTPGGRCESCNCNNNIDVLRPGNCDARTGECKQCLFNTEGFYCDRCKSGFFGDAIEQLCQECVCNLLGSDQKAGPCNRITGQCSCLPNVVGQKCDQCDKYHWKLASGEGCEPCKCDLYGSHSEQCNEYDGQCECKPGYGGRQCNECQQNYWGNPNVECFACKCDQSGSTSLQCHRNNGSCICQDGIGGERCDKCARGYVGSAPYCDPCGECFDNWDITINNIRIETYRLIEEAKVINQSGVKGAYEEFNEMERKIKRIYEILANANVTNVDIESLQQAIDQIRRELQRNKEYFKSVDSEVDDTTNRISDARLQLEGLKLQAKEVEKEAEDLKNQARILQEADVDGALNITRDAHRRSQIAQAKVEGSERNLELSKVERKRTDNVIEQGESFFNRTFSENEASLNDISFMLSEMEGEIPGLNNQVCGARTDQCDLLCGGAGCKSCGGLSCDKGATTKAANAMSLAEDADKLLREKEKQTNELQISVAQANRNAHVARDEAQLAYDKAASVKNYSEEVKIDLDDLLDRIQEYLDTEMSKPSEIRTYAEQVLSKSISLDPAQIREMARQINITISSLTNIEKILAETRGDLERARELKRRADRAKMEAVGILDIVDAALKALEDAREAQEKARRAIRMANEEIGHADDDLVSITSETVTAQGIAGASLKDVENLKELLQEIKKKNVENDVNVKRAVSEAGTAFDLATQAENGAKNLERKYNDARSLLERKAAKSAEAKRKAEELRDKANELVYTAKSKLERLRIIEEEFNLHERLLTDFSFELQILSEEMTTHLTIIEERSIMYRDCTP